MKWKVVPNVVPYSEEDDGYGFSYAYSWTETEDVPLTATNAMDYEGLALVRVGSPW